MARPKARNKECKSRSTGADASEQAPTLAELQARFQDALMGDDERVLDLIAENARERTEVLLGVYRNAYVVRLIDFLKNDYPKLAELTGDEQFIKLARSYIAAHPSRTPNARWFGAKFPEHLATSDLAREHPVLAELARFEKALNDAFDAPDAPCVGLEHLAAIAPENWPELTFAPHPSVELLRLETNAVAIWQALEADETPPAPERLAEPQQLLVYRQALTAHFRALGAEEAMMWREAVRGVAFGVLCEMVATFGGEADAPMRAGTYLKGWLEAGLLAGTAAPSATNTD